jgi:hypothetical protein
MPIYQLAFHLPYFASRSSTTPVLDHRHGKNDKPLRRTIDVSFLDPKGNRKAFMYPAHISCVIAGSDLERWVAYMFVDNFFDSDDASDSVQYIEQIRRNDEYTLNYDPFTRGLKNANEPIRDPRGVFVRALRIRLDQIKHEWTQTVTKLQQSFEDYEPIIVCPPQE